MKVFISRTQFPESDFKQALEGKGIPVHGEALIEINTIPFKAIPEGDWLFFYSKSGVQHFFSQLSSIDKLAKKLAVMGPGTAKALARYGLHADFVGDGVPMQTAEAFVELASGQTVVFVRAEQSRCSVQRLLKNEIQVKDLIVYENKERKSLNLPYCDFLVFTSPMNVRAYFSTYVLHDSQKVVAIGEITMKELQGLGVSKVYMPKHPSEMGLAEVVLEVVKS